MTERLYTPDEVAELLSVSLRSVRRWTRTGRLKGVKVGRFFRYRPDDVKVAMYAGVQVGA
ncbi:MAG TPA: helix-turn-helix domain-containing protein [Urbifossiella sp.]|jgi:excisionase family DNA binding protein|nr:helix-turn-helix domain-containing protein [Urbifossiella sp.]